MSYNVFFPIWSNTKFNWWWLKQLGLYLNSVHLSRHQNRRHKVTNGCRGTWTALSKHPKTENFSAVQDETIWVQDYNTWHFAVHTKTRETGTKPSGSVRDEEIKRKDTEQECARGWKRKKTRGSIRALRGGKKKKIRRRMMSLVDIVDYDDYIRKVPPFLHRLKRAPF